MHWSNLTLKSLTSTRWSSRKAACKSLHLDWLAILNVLKFIKGLGSSDEQRLLQKLTSLEVAFMTVVWNAIFEKINAMSIQLQSE